VPTAAELWARADFVFKVRAPSTAEVALMREGGSLLSFIWPAQNPELMQQLAAKKATVLAIDSLPRQLSRAQKMDALTSMAGISGYRAVIEAANAFGRFFNGQITAAGKIPPAKVFIAGAGVAGLAAIGTAANLGAIVRANDTRAEVADQVVSLGGEFVKVDYEEEGSGGGGYAKVMSEGFLQAQREMYAKQAQEADIIITTALIPGKPAPKLITAEMVQSMKPGSVIVDMAGEQGGNCELTVPGEAVVRHGVTIIGYTDLVSRLAKQSSTLYSTNLFRVTEELCKTKDGVINVNFEDDAIRGLTVIKEGNITWPPPPHQASGRGAQAGCGSRPPRPPPRRGMAMAAPANRCRPSRWPRCLAWVRWPSCYVGLYAPASFLSHFTVFVLACFVGYMVVWNVTPSLHTPLMSVTNAISSIIAIGALVQVAPPLDAAGAANRPNALILGLAVFALALTAVNMFGGFAVTRRMLAMFRK
jgi:NAD(P) transhydrogenase subunit alpha